MKVLGLIGIGVAGIGQERIAITIAAASRGHHPALLQCVKAAASHGGSDVLAAILPRRRRRRHRDKREREQGRRGRGDFQKLFHVVLSVLVLAPKSTHGRSGTVALSAPKKSKTIPSGARRKIEMQRARSYCSMIIIQLKTMTGNQF